MYPGRTVMDLVGRHFELPWTQLTISVPQQSLAAALYFAARGHGQVRNAATTEARPYTSPARVLLNGLGSDELLGGYGRFRTAYKAAGWQAIVDEVSTPVRNH